MLGSGTPSLSSETGCQLPCRRDRYTTSEQINLDANAIPVDTFVQMKANETVIVVQKPGRLRETHKTEVRAYTFGDFMSDVGGLLGLFLGLSVWGVMGAAKDLGNLVSRAGVAAKSKHKASRSADLSQTDLFSSGHNGNIKLAH